MININKKILRNHKGFSLIELSIVLVIVGMLLSGIVASISEFTVRSRISRAESELQLVKEALIGFVIAEGRFPCPDVDGDGAEDGCAGVNQTHGTIPSVDLGLNQLDPWNVLYGYSVDNDFADAPAAGNNVTFDLDDDGDFTILDANGGANVAINIPVVIYSVGPNGNITLAAASNDEDENLDNDPVFVDKEFAPDYDDALVWVVPGILKLRMIAAGRLPE